VASKTHAQCGRCGRAGRSFDPARYVCADCRAHGPAEEFKGRRVRVGLIWKFIPDPDDPDLMEVLQRNFDANPVDLPQRHLCDCGCLLTAPDESCPNCLIWAHRNAVQTSWSTATIYRRGT
jgi:ribosomal protein L37E